MQEILIIAEAGVNHNGDLNLAKKMIDVAAEAGCNIVKFQTFNSQDIASKQAPKAIYQERTTGKKESQLEMLQSLELTVEQHKVLMAYCIERNIAFLSTAFDLKSIDVLIELGLQIFKIPSCNITHFPYLKKIGQFNKKIILSTGMSNLGEVEDALEVLVDSGTERGNITVLHCHSDYPTRLCEVNLNAMKTLGDAFKLNIGLSDHTQGIEVPIAAAAMGAKVIEKHFTLDKTMQGPDHKASLDPIELQEMVHSIRNIELALGDGIKKASGIELENRKTMRQSIHFIRDLKKGDIVLEHDLIMKRPGDGISPMMMDLVLGRELQCDVGQDMPLDWTQVS